MNKVLLDIVWLYSVMQVLFEDVCTSLTSLICNNNLSCIDHTFCTFNSSKMNPTSQPHRASYAFVIIFNIHFTCITLTVITNRVNSNMAVVRKLANTA